MKMHLASVNCCPKRGSKIISKTTITKIDIDLPKIPAFSPKLTFSSNEHTDAALLRRRKNSDALSCTEGESKESEQRKT